MRRDVFAPIGPAYVAARLEADGYRTAVRIYRHRRGSRALLDVVRRHRPLILGFSATGNEIPVLKDVTRSLKSEFPELPIVAGGYCSLAADELFEDSGVDAVVLGEGEETMAELAPRLVDRGDLSDVAGVAYRSGTGDVRSNAPRAPIADLDALPVPVYEHVPRRPRLLRVYASRGCPYECSFCEIKDFYRRRPPRHHSAGYVSRLVDALMERAGGEVEHLYFNDDEFLLHAEHLAEMASVARDFDLTIVFQTRVTDVLRHSDALAAHRDAIHEVHMGLESMCAAQLKRWRKKTTPATNREAASVLADLDIGYYPYIILTDAHTTPAELRETCEGLLTLPPAPVTVRAEGESFRTCVAPLRREIHLNRLKAFTGEILRRPGSSYLEAVWDFLGATAEEASSLTQAYLGVAARSSDDRAAPKTPGGSLESAGTVLDRRLSRLPEIASRARDGDLDVVGSEIARFVDAARVCRASLLAASIGWRTETAPRDASAGGRR